MIMRIFADMTRLSVMLQMWWCIHMLFSLGNKGGRLRLVVSDYGFNRLLKDSLDGLIDIEAGSLTVQAFNYPDITDEAIDKDIKRKKAMLIEAFKTGQPLPEEIRRMIHEADTI